MNIKICQYCSANFEVENRDFNRGRGKFCSKTCCGASKKGSRKVEPNTICSFCQKPYHVMASKLQTKSGLHFCSRSCKDLAQRIENNFTSLQPAHYGSGITSYREQAFRTLPLLCARCGYDKIPEILEVHHRNRDRTDNSISNLEIICPTCHETHHFTEKTGKWRPR